MILNYIGKNIPAVPWWTVANHKRYYGKHAAR